MSTRRRSLRSGAGARAVAGLICLLCACGPENRPAGEGGAGAGAGNVGGSTAGTSAGTAGSAGAPANNGGATGAAGTPAGGTDGSAGAAGTTAGANNADAGSGGISAGGSSGAAVTGGAGQASGAFTLMSPALDPVAGCSVETPSPCDVFPDENVSYMGNANRSPELRWMSPPTGTQSFVVVLVDVTFGQAHWVMWNIPADVTTLAANVPKDASMLAVPSGARQANAIFATEEGDGYFGPHIPCNVFAFEIYALSMSSFSPMDPTSAGLVYIELQELGDKILGSAKLTGRSNDYMMTCE